jgi:hypothetical protein
VDNLPPTNLAPHQQPVAEEMKTVRDRRFEGEHDFLFRMLQVHPPLGPQGQLTLREKTFARRVSPSETYSKSQQHNEGSNSFLNGDKVRQRYVEIEW